MSVVNLGSKTSLAVQFLNDIRNVERQTDRMRFRKNMERLGEIMAYEISKTLSYQSRTINTPLAKHETKELSNYPVIITVLRAGLTYFQGFLNYFDQSDAGFIGAYRKEGSDEITINLEYLATPDLTGRTVILVDPMLATGNSFLRSVNAMLKHGTPAHVHIASLIASPEGIQLLKDNLTLPYTLWTFAEDLKLNDKFYIVPGLGDAGDLSYGEKL